jgi:sugar lactone lactonase YvrE
MKSMNTLLKKIAFSFVVLSTLVSFTQDTTDEKITFESDKLYPEGITHNEKNNLLYLSSLSSGKVSAVDERGNCKVVCDDSRLISTVGIKYNPKTGKIYAAHSDVGLSSKSNEATKLKIAQLAIIDAASGKLEEIIELSDLVPGKHLANDLTFDKDDNIYVTDSYAHVIYKVDKNRKKSVFAKSDSFVPDSNAIGLNGIAWNEEGYLLVAKTGEGSLLKVSLKDPSKVEKVKLPEPMLWADGIFFLNPQELVVVRNRFTKAVYLRSKDNWQSAEITKEVKCSDLMPTTATYYKGKTYIINSRLSELRENKVISKQFVIDIF